MKKTLAFALGASLLALPGTADHWRGIRATVQDVDHLALEVDISVTGYTEGEPFAEQTLEELTTEEFSTGIGYYEGQYPAISWGDGETLSETELPPVIGVVGEESAKYRRAFSHTYEAPGQYTIRVHSGTSAPGPGETGYSEIVVGNYVAEARLLSHTAQVNLGLATEAAVPISRPALVLLAALLGGAAVWVVRRSG